MTTSGGVSPSPKGRRIGAGSALSKSATVRRSSVGWTSMWNEYMYVYMLDYQALWNHSSTGEAGVKVKNQVLSSNVDFQQ